MRGEGGEFGDGEGWEFFAGGGDGELAGEGGVVPDLKRIEILITESGDRAAAGDAGAAAPVEGRAGRWRSAGGAGFGEGGVPR